MPKRIVKLCKVCGEVHDFRRSWWKQAKRGGYNICFKWRLSLAPIVPITVEGLKHAIDVVSNAFAQVDPKRN